MQIVKASQSNEGKNISKPKYDLDMIPTINTDALVKHLFYFAMAVLS